MIENATGWLLLSILTILIVGFIVSSRKMVKEVKRRDRETKKAMGFFDD